MRQIFDATDRTRGVYFFDEFDALGSERAIANDVGEIRRVLNSFLQMIEQDRSHSMVMAATNHPGILDRALFRRFDDILHFDLPDESQIAKLLKMRLAGVAQGSIRWSELASRRIRGPGTAGDGNLAHSPMVLTHKASYYAFDPGRPLPPLAGLPPVTRSL